MFSGQETAIHRKPSQACRDPKPRKRTSPRAKGSEGARGGGRRVRRQGGIRDGGLPQEDGGDAEA